MNREVEGALIDLYVVSTQKDLSSNPHLRVYQVYDYQKTYGVVLAGASMKLEKCFLDFVELNKADIVHKIEETIKHPTVIKLRTVSLKEETAYSKEIVFLASLRFLTNKYLRFNKHTISTH